VRIKILVIVVLSIGTLCSSKRQENVGCREFEFKNLNKDTNKWKEEAPFEQVNDSFFKEHIYRIEELSHRDLKSLYNVCTIATGKMKGFVIAELNGPSWNMYFIPESDGKMFVLASLEVSPDDYLMKKSKLVGDGLEMTKVYISNEGSSEAKDSVVTRYSIEKNLFKKIKSDSIRSTK
jgi:hypothetical protein